MSLDRDYVPSSRPLNTSVYRKAGRPLLDAMRNLFEHFVMAWQVVCLEPALLALLRDRRRDDSCPPLEEQVWYFASAWKKYAPFATGHSAVDEALADSCEGDEFLWWLDRITASFFRAVRIICHGMPFVLLLLALAHITQGFWLEELAPFRLHPTVAALAEERLSVVALLAKSRSFTVHLHDQGEPMPTQKSVEQFYDCCRTMEKELKNRSAYLPPGLRMYYAAIDPRAATDTQGASATENELYGDFDPPPAYEEVAREAQNVL